MPMPVCHPGQTLVAAMLDNDWRLSELAQRLDIDRDNLADFLNTHTDITPELASKIAALLDTSVEFWLNLQANFNAAELAASKVPVSTDAA